MGYLLPTLLLLSTAAIVVNSQATPVDYILCFSRPAPVASLVRRSCIYYATTTDWLHWYVGNENRGGYPPPGQQINTISHNPSVTFESVYFTFSKYDKNVTESFAVLTFALSYNISVAYATGNQEIPHQLSVPTTVVQYSDETSDSLQIIKLSYLQELVLPEDNSTKTHVLVCHSAAGGSLTYCVNETSVLCKNIADLNRSDDTFRSNNRTCFILNHEQSETYNITAVIIINSNFEVTVTCSVLNESDSVQINTPESVTSPTPADYLDDSTSPTYILYSTNKGNALDLRSSHSLQWFCSILAIFCIFVTVHPINSYS